MTLSRHITFGCEWPAADWSSQCRQQTSAHYKLTNKQARKAVAVRDGWLSIEDIDFCGPGDPELGLSRPNHASQLRDEHMPSIHP